MTKMAKQPYDWPRTAPTTEQLPNRSQVAVAPTLAAASRVMMRTMWRPQAQPMMRVRRNSNFCRHVIASATVCARRGLGFGMLLPLGRQPPRKYAIASATVRARRGSGFGMAPPSAQQPPTAQRSGVLEGVTMRTPVPSAAVTVVTRGPACQPNRVARAFSASQEEQASMLMQQYHPRLVFLPLTTELRLRKALPLRRAPCGARMPLRRWLPCCCRWPFRLARPTSAKLQVLAVAMAPSRHKAFVAVATTILPRPTRRGNPAPVDIW